MDIPLIICTCGNGRFCRIEITKALRRIRGGVHHSIFNMDERGENTAQR